MPSGVAAGTQSDCVGRQQSRSALLSLLSSFPPVRLRLSLFWCMATWRIVAAAAATASASGDPIRVGVFECLAPSPTACFVPRIDVLHRMWFDAVNARGGLLGRTTLQVVARISASSVADEAEMEQAARQFIAQHVDFVVWPTGGHTHLVRGCVRHVFCRVSHCCSLCDVVLL